MTENIENQYKNLGFPEETFVLTLENATVLYDFTNHVYLKGKKVFEEDGNSSLIKSEIEKNPEKYKEFVEDIEGLMDYLRLMIEGKQETITIPEDHRRMYLSILETLKYHMMTMMTNLIEGIFNNSPNDTNSLFKH